MIDETKTNPATAKPHDPDWAHVGALLNVIHGAASAGPKYSYIVSRAEAMLAKHMQENPEAPAVDPVTPVTAPPASLSAAEPESAPVPPSGDGDPGQDATAPTTVERRV
jgi:hypothetical protein